MERMRVKSQQRLERKRRPCDARDDEDTDTATLAGEQEQEEESLREPLREEEEERAPLVEPELDEFMDVMETEMLRSHETLDRDLLKSPQPEQELRVRVVCEVQSKMVQTQRGRVFELGTPSMGIFRAPSERVSLGFRPLSDCTKGRSGLCPAKPYRPFVFEMPGTPEAGCDGADNGNTPATGPTPDSSSSSTATTIDQYFKVVRRSAVKAPNGASSVAAAAHSETEGAVA